MSLLSKLTQNIIGTEKIFSPKFTDATEVAEPEIQWNQPNVIIECSKNSLLKGINLVLGAVPSKSNIDILECLLIDALSDKIKLLANDMELGVETIIKGKIISKGIIALNAKLFHEIVCKLPDANIIIEVDNEYKTTITSKENKISITGKLAEEFPYPPIIENQNDIIVSQPVLKEVIRQTIFSISDCCNNKLMTGELFEINDDVLKLISLDGHRISIRKVKINNSHIHKKIIVSGKALIEISKILSEDMDKNVRMFFTDEYISFEFESTMVTSRLIQGEYFKIDHMLSNEYATKVTVNKQELINGINLAMIFTTENKTPIIIEAEKDNMKLYTNSAVGGIYTELNAQKSGEDIVIGLNPKFLIDVLKVIDDEEVNLYMINPKAPCFIKDNERKYTYLILPVNINNVKNLKPVQTQTTSTTPPVQTQSILDERQIFNHIKAMPVKWEFGSPDVLENESLKKLCSNFINSKPVLSVLNPEAFKNMELVIQQKRTSVLTYSYLN